MKTLSMDLRERILSTYDKEDATREQVAKRYRVSLGMVKKLLQQRRHTGDIGSRRHLRGRKPKILESHRSRMREAAALYLSSPPLAYDDHDLLGALGWIDSVYGHQWRHRHAGFPRLCA